MSPGEIALSILAEIVLRRHGADRRPARDDSRAIDPICGMSVDRASAKHTLEIGGEMYYFCCPHCKASFAKAHA
jgi:xanthine dehydrogenase accessory factor